MTKNSLYRLIYVSAMSPGFPNDPSDQDHEIGKIIQSAIRNNRASDITGLLLVHQSWFLQTLEGPETAVRATYDRIRSDGRHVALRLIGQGKVDSRQFGNWNMCAARLSAADDAILATLNRRGVFEPHRLTAATALRLLVAVGGIQARKVMETTF